jgi:hypothetical protein
MKGFAELCCVKCSRRISACYSKNKALFLIMQIIIITCFFSRGQGLLRSLEGQA